MAEAIGAVPVRLAPGSKAAYHAAAVLAAGGFVALLDAIAELGRVAGLDEAGSLAIYGPLIEGTLGNARALGIRAALTGPMTRGDVGTLASHLDTLRAHAPGVVELYVAAARREIDLAEDRGALAPEVATMCCGSVHCRGRLPTARGRCCLRRPAPTFEPGRTLTRFARSAAVAAAPEPSATSLARLSHPAARIAPMISSSVTVAISTPKRDTIESGSAPTNGGVMPSASVPFGRETGTGFPGGYRRAKPGPAASSTATTRASGRTDFTAVATPPISPPPPTGT